MFLKIDKNTRLVTLYDTIADKEVKVSGSTAREILQHPQQSAEGGPRFITIDEKKAHDDAKALEAKARELLRSKPQSRSISDVVASIRSTAVAGDERLTDNGNPKKASVEQELGREVSQSEYLAAIRG